MKLERLNEIRLITQNFHFFMILSSNFGKKFLILSSKNSKNILSEADLRLLQHPRWKPLTIITKRPILDVAEALDLLLPVLQFTFINDQPNATFSESTLNHVAVNFVCIKSCTTLILCNKVSLFGKVYCSLDHRNYMNCRCGTKNKYH